MIYLGIGLLVGFCAGVIAITLLGARHATELHAENEALRRALRYVRGAAIQHPELAGLRRYIDRALDDEVGA